ncbi:MAG: cysteine peptidase family C39 domain-containing protein [Patescibacteria group bacterium]
MKPLAPYQSPVEGKSGLACLKMVLEHAGKEVIELDLASTIGINHETTEPTREQLVEAAKKEGANVSTSPDGELDDLRMLTEQNMPCMVELDAPRQFVIVYQIGKTKIFCMDPLTEQGIRIITIEDFESRWTKWFLGAFAS